MCCSCWRAVFHPRAQEQHPPQNNLYATIENEENSGCCPWIRVLKIQNRQQRFQSQSPTQPESGSSHELASENTVEDQVDDHSYSQIDDAPVCCPWIRTFHVSNAQQRPSPKLDDDRPYDMAHEIPQIGCCKWTAVFWVNKNQSSPTAHTST